MKTSKLVIIIFSVISLTCNLTEPNHPEEGKPQIRFQNITANQLNDLTVAGKFIGSLASNSITDYLSFDEFTFDTGMPDEDASANIGGVMFTNYNRGYWCGTEKITIYSGKYLVKVAIIDTVLFLSCDNAPTIFNP